MKSAFNCMVALTLLFALMPVAHSQETPTSRPRARASLEEYADEITTTLVRIRELQQGRHDGYRDEPKLQQLQEQALVLYGQAAELMRAGVKISLEPKTIQVSSVAFSRRVARTSAGLVLAIVLAGAHGTIGSDPVWYVISTIGAFVGAMSSSFSMNLRFYPDSRAAADKQLGRIFSIPLNFWRSLRNRRRGPKALENSFQKFFARIEGGLEEAGITLQIEGGRHDLAALEGAIVGDLMESDVRICQAAIAGESVDIKGLLPERVPLIDP